MKRFINYISLFGVLGLVLPACEPKFDEVTPEKGSVDLTRYVAVGDYITAGYTNGVLTQEGQQYAYPSILAQQFAKAGSNATFIQPSLNGLEGQQEVMLTGYANDGSPILSESETIRRIFLATCESTPLPTFSRYSSSPLENIQNLGVPGLRIRQINRTGVGNIANNLTPMGNPPKFNPYFERMLPANDQRTYLKVAAASKPTFFTCWLGMSDMVAYINSGGTNCGSLPSKSNFEVEIAALLDSLSAKGTRRGAVCNLPTFEDLAISKILSANTQTALNSLNKGDSIFIRSNNAGIRPLAYNDNLLPKVMSKIGRKDANLDTATINGTLQVIPYGMHRRNPIANDEVFDGFEAGILKDNISQFYNEYLRLQITEPKGKYNKSLVVVNMNTLFLNLRSGIIINGVKYNNNPVTGGFFSLDNFSLTPRGQAIVANQIIQTMNGAFGSTIPEVDVNAFPLLKGL